uniref:Uncharacterized protein n=1 Tax=Fibrocapsa japonica TaxID=94617 RepID=A0A7S2Y0K7_9STRA|mmetsp:Transcript_6731/g.10149  ORF Transcript_6731/g.10149 Transcript_6731/m.10149 type:complete len:117 (+) Transcript_6731:112-462(+)
MECLLGGQALEEFVAGLQQAAGAEGASLDQRTAAAQAKCLLAGGKSASESAAREASSLVCCPEALEGRGVSFQTCCNTLQVLEEDFSACPDVAGMFKAMCAEAFPLAPIFKSAKSS